MNKWSRTVLVSLIPAVVGGVIALGFFGDPTGSGEGWLWALVAAFAAMVTGALCWWCFVERHESVTRGNFILAGFVCGIVAHPVMWLTYFLIAEVLSGSTPIDNYDQVIGTVAGMIALSLIFVGWATAAVGALGGWLFWIFWGRQAVAA